MFTTSESRRERRQYRNYYKKVSHQRSYIAQVGRWLGYSWEEMKKRWIYPGINDKSFGTCQVRYRSGRFWIDEIPFKWDTGKLLRELLRLQEAIQECPDVMYKQTAKRWLRRKIFAAKVLHYRGSVKVFIMRGLLMKKSNKK